MLNQEKENTKIIPSQKIKVFISSKCDKADEPPKYDPIRAELKRSIEMTGLAEVYTFEGEEASTLSAGAHYTFALEDSDVCIFLIDNSDGIPDGVKAEIDVVQRNNIKALYYFCDESKKEKTSLEKSLFNISDDEFKKIFSNEKLYLPIRWDNKDFVGTLEKLFKEYRNTVEQQQHNNAFNPNIEVNDRKIKQVCNLIVSVVKQYLNGFPAKAFESFCKLMRLLEQQPLQTYYKSITEHFDVSNYHDPLNLFRITCVTENVPYERSRVFHTPYYLRSKVSTSRYSIAGFPSLYLGTSLELCHEEVQHNPHEQLALASRFQLERNFEYNNIEIKVIELAIKPQDFFVERNRFDTYRNTRIIPEGVLKRVNVREAYLLWYPLIAACSFIRVNKKEPFAAEYIIPQLLMQWVRSEMGTPKQNYDRLVGIRYFSCASVRASDMGFNYVFPASGKHTKESFCPTLSRAFKLTKPYFLHEYRDIYSCEDALRKDNNLDFI